MCVCVCSKKDLLAKEWWNGNWSPGLFGCLESVADVWTLSKKPKAGDQGLQAPQFCGNLIGVKEVATLEHSTSVRHAFGLALLFPRYAWKGRLRLPRSEQSAGLRRP